MFISAAFGALYTYVVLSDPEGSNPVAVRATVIPHDGLKYELGLADTMDEEE